MTPDVSTAGWSAWPAPAKVNLFLRIVGRRADGYHLLQTAFQLLDWGDTVHLRPRSDGVVARPSGAPGVTEHDDLVVRAAHALRQATGARQGADIVVDKRIPIGGGFGGGSSDAATVLVALNRLWDCGLDEAALAQLGLGLGADVPVFVRGRSAWAEGVGERLVPIAIPAHHYVLLDPGVHVPTGQLFQAPDLTRNAQPVKMGGSLFDIGLGNAFEPVLRKRAPEIDAALRAMGEFGDARLTGSGSGCFLAFADRDAAARAQQALQRDWRTWLAAGVDRSPLHAALQC